MPVENIDGARRYRSYILRKKMSPFVYALVFILISCKSKCARASGSKMLPDLMLKKRKEKKKAEFDESAPVIRRNYSALLVAKRISSVWFTRLPFHRGVSCGFNSRGNQNQQA